MLADQAIAHIFGDKYSNLVLRNNKMASWQQSLIATDSLSNGCLGNGHLGDLFCQQSVHGVCAPIVGYEVLSKRKACTVSVFVVWFTKFLRLAAALPSIANR